MNGNQIFWLAFKKTVADKHQKLIFEIPLEELCMGFIEPYINSLTIDFNQFLAKPFEKGYVTSLYILYLLIMYIISHP